MEKQWGNLSYLNLPSFRSLLLQSRRRQSIHEKSRIDFLAAGASFMYKTTTVTESSMDQN